MKTMKKIGVLLLGILMLSSTFKSEALAASASVKVSSVSGNVGSKVTVTCTASASGTDIGGADVVLRYDASALTAKSASGGASASAGSVRYSGYASSAGSSSISFSVTFEILKEGSFPISVETGSVYDWESAASLSTSTSGGKVTGKAVTSAPSTPSTPSTPATPSTPSETEKPTENKDNNSKLSALSVYPGNLSPVFHAATTSYTVVVGKEVSEITISASAASEKARISVTGGKDLKLGDNAAKVVVTAEDGSTTVYQLTITCGEVEKILISGSEYTIAENFADDVIPAGFNRGEVTYNEYTYQGLKNETGSMQLLYLQSEEKAGFYLYFEETDSFYPYVTVEIAKDNWITLLPIKENVVGTEKLEKETILYLEQELEAWKLDEEFSLVAVIAQDGVEKLYRYDKVDGTFQRYQEITVQEVEEEKEPFALEGYTLYLIIGLAVLSSVLILTIVIMMLTRRRRYSARKRKYQKKLEKQHNNQKK